jgi:hypothetical protein
MQPPPEHPHASLAHNPAPHPIPHIHITRPQVVKVSFEMGIMGMLREVEKSTSLTFIDDLIIVGKAERTQELCDSLS